VLPACRPDFAAVALSTLSFEQSCIIEAVEIGGLCIPLYRVFQKELYDLNYPR
jgi:hypothetical protein